MSHIVYQIKATCPSGQGDRLEICCEKSRVGSNPAVVVCIILFNK